MKPSEEIDTIFEEVNKLLTEEACSRSESEKRDLIHLGLEKAARLLEIAPDYHNTHHLHGLLWYHHPESDSTISKNIKTFSPANRAFRICERGHGQEP